jgi:hypothetical protein
MNILINAVGCVTGGAFVVFKELMEEAKDKLNQRNSRYTILISEYTFNRNKAFFQIDCIGVVKVVPNFFRIYGRIIFEIYILVNKWRYDYYFNLSNYGFPGGRISILYYHNPFVHKHENLFGLNGKSNIIKTLLLKTACSTHKYVIVQSMQLKLYFETFANKKVKIIHHKYKLYINEEIAISKKELQDMYGISSDYFIYPSSGFPHKNEHIFCKIAEFVNQKYPHLQFVLTTKASRLSNSKILNIGMVDRLHSLALIKYSLGVIFTSEEETLGLPLLEAIYYKKRCLVIRKEYSINIFGTKYSYLFDWDNATDSMDNSFVVALNYVRDCTALGDIDYAMSERETIYELFDRIIGKSND